MDSDAPRPLPEVLRSFKRSAFLLKKAAEAAAASDSLCFQLSFTQGEAATGLFSENVELVRLATLLRPFMNPNSAIEFRGVWSRLAETGLIDESTRHGIDALIEWAETSPVQVVLNGEEITARDLYFTYGDGEFFSCTPEAEKTLKELTFGPMEEMVPFLYYSACMTFSQLVLAILEAVRLVERIRPTCEAHAGPEPQCIYCLTSDGDFTSEEHVIPESLGNDELILRGAVCDVCNNKLSVLEQSLMDFEPVAFLRVLNVPYTKKGKFPRADFRDCTIEKVKPREIVFASKTKRDIFVHEQDAPPGMIRFTTQMHSRRPFDPLPIGRALFKIGLGLVAYDSGVECACDARYDVARGFIAGGNGMPNHLIMETSVVPNHSLSTAWQVIGPATPVTLDIYGLRLHLNLDATPFPVEGVVLPEGFMQFWLGGGHVARSDDTVSTSAAE
jgi:hypothetical protein